MKQRFLTDKQVARMEQQFEEVCITLRKCSPAPETSDYIPIKCVWVHRKELVNVPYRCNGEDSEVFYRGQFRIAQRELFTLHDKE